MVVASSFDRAACSAVVRVTSQNSPQLLVSKKCTGLRHRRGVDIDLQRRSASLEHVVESGWHFNDEQKTSGRHRRIDRVGRYFNGGREIGFKECRHDAAGELGLRSVRSGSLLWQVD